MDDAAASSNAGAPFDPFPPEVSLDDLLQSLDLPDLHVDPPPPPPPLPPPSPVAPTVDLPDYSVLSDFDFDVGGSNAAPSVVPPPAGAGPSAVVQPLLDCSGCQLMREVFHTNGLQDMKLSIHGAPGVFYHATMEVYHYPDGFTPATQQSYIDFRSENYQSVKRFLIDYAVLRVRDNFIVLQDSISAFFDVLCTTMDIVDDATAAGGGEHGGSSAGQNVPSSGPSQTGNAAEQQPLPVIKSALAMQRERTGKLQLSDLAGYFHLPINDAAKELDICATALKRICRKHGIPRWPHRKIRSIDKKISCLTQELRARFGDGAGSTEQIENLKALKSRICGGRA